MTTDNATTPPSRSAQPFLKWAGGKGRLIEQIAPFLPDSARTYYEPFVGSGALFFFLKGKGFASRYVLSDANSELIITYRTLRDHPEQVISLLRVHQARHDRTYYNAIRAMDRDEDWLRMSTITRASRLIYLNQTCYNGLWRVNSKGQFNVPMGRYDNPGIAQEYRLRGASAALRGAEIIHASYVEAVEEARRGDFVYFDPPYLPLNSTSNFTSYNKDGFGLEDQQTLAGLFSDLDRRGCFVMLSNASHPFIRELYAPYRIETIHARRAINRDPDRRGMIEEVLVMNYD